MTDSPHSSPKVQISTPLFGAALYLGKALNSDGKQSDRWKFAGIASADTMDFEGETILRRSIDLSYIQARGYVNWEHSKAVEDQVGYTTSARIIDITDIPRLEDELGVALSPSSTVFVSGELYKNVKAAQNIMDILTSIPEGQEGSLGLSVDGAKATNEDGDVLRAIVRGVAITTRPAHTDTIARLVKSIGDGVQNEVDSLTKHTAPGLTFSAAVVRLMELRPYLSLKLAKDIVSYSFSQQN